VTVVVAVMKVVVEASPPARICAKEVTVVVAVMKVVVEVVGPHHLRLAFARGR
jgi:hypothetical protein